jgi:penicillin-insensitive murein DD-endopeptidase
MARNPRPNPGSLASSIALAALLGLSLDSVSAGSSWDRVSYPSRGISTAIGSAANGCIGGAEALPESGPGYVSVRRSRNRYFGHPELVRLVENLGRSVEKRGIGLAMIGDLSQPRGGRMPSSHHSHQNGIDVDIWFTLAPSANAARSLMDDRPDPQSMVLPASVDTSPAWGPNQRYLLETAARMPDVDRIFVNAAIKRALCEQVGGDRSWLRKIRPWFGHDAHFHLRMRCPADSPSCEPQKPVPPGDGCGADLAWWLSPEARRPMKKKSEPTVEPNPPAACLAVLSAP